MPDLTPQGLQALVVAIFRGMGSDGPEAQEAAAHLVRANLCGHDSHGVGMLPTYVRLHDEGKLVPNQSLATIVDDGPILVVDGRLGVGQRMAADAVRLAISRARSVGACVLGLRNAAHIGRVGTYAELCAAQGMIFVAFVNVATGPRLQAPYGGSDARLGTNPFVASMPRPDAPPVLLDMATTGIAYGKARVAYNAGMTVPAGTVIDGAGHPTTDPTGLVAHREGALLPFGGHKAGGLALMCEILGAAVTGGFRADDPAGSGVANSFLALVLDPARLGADPAAVAAACAHLTASPAAPGHDRVRLPGEPEAESEARRRRDGIPVDDTTWAELVAAAASFGLDADALVAA